MIKKIVLALSLPMLPLALCAQKDAKFEADKAYNHLSYQKAADLYQKLEAGNLDAVSKAKLADSYRLNGDTESAEYWYEQAAGQTGDAEDLLHYAQVLQSNNKCEKALDWYQQYRRLVGENHPLPRASAISCDELLLVPKQQLNITNLKGINSGHLDFSPIPYRGGIVFTSTRGSQEHQVEDLWTKDNFTDLFYSNKIGETSFSGIEVLKGEINGSFHDGTATFNKAGTKMYFTRNDEQGKNQKQVVDLKIYTADLVNNQWVNVEELPINLREYSTCHPTLSADGRTLFFASNRMGGLGGMDIYKTVRTGNEWSTPENLGTSVNTAGNEIFPFIAEDGNLYFASNGHKGVGGLDVYVVRPLPTGQWGVAENLGEPINSPKDDFGYTILESGEEGYFSSNRGGGQGGDDIYQWSKNNALNQQNVISVIDESTGDRLSDALVTVAEGIMDEKSNNSTSLKVNVADVQTATFFSQPISLLTDTKGKVKPEIKTGKTYTIFVKKPGYASVKKVINSNELLKTSEYTVPLRKIKGIPLMGTVINEGYNDVFIPNAKVELFNFCTGEYETALSDDAGSFQFYLTCGCDYELTATKERFNQDKKSYSTVGRDCETPTSLSALMYLKAGDTPAKPKPATKPVTNTKPTPPPTPVTPPPAPVIIPEAVKVEKEYRVGQVISLDNLYYDYNKFVIRSDAAIELEIVVDLLLQYPDMEIELGSHTDSRGNDTYNQELSQKRADSAINYIISRGVSTSRLMAKGYGEAKTINGCEDGINCNEQEHQDNRRTEIKITKMGNADVKVEYKKH